MFHHGQTSLTISRLLIAHIAPTQIRTPLTLGGYLLF
jgi:hypothetical protein